MSWISAKELTWCQRFAMNVIKVGPMPYHVAFIMDGNRRFAAKSKIEKIEGHSHGFSQLSEALSWCLKIGIKEVTVYAFSIENFKRTKEEVDGLMDMATEKFNKLLTEIDNLNEKGICVRVVGDLKLLPLDLRIAIAKAMLATQHNCKLYLNVAMAYTSRDEFVNALKVVQRGVKDKLIQMDDVSNHLVRKCMYTRHMSEPDLLIRTSGERRLSDFLMWQITTTILYFTDTLWPEFTFWHFLAGILRYQMDYGRMQEVKVRINEILDEKYKNDEQEKRINAFLRLVDDEFQKELESLASL